jgi:hypothetical protein
VRRHYEQDENNTAPTLSHIRDITSLRVEALQGALSHLLRFFRRKTFISDAGTHFISKWNFLDAFGAVGINPNMFVGRMMSAPNLLFASYKGLFYSERSISRAKVWRSPSEPSFKSCHPKNCNVAHVSWAMDACVLADSQNLFLFF